MVEGGGVCLHVSCDVDNEFWSGGRWRGLSTCILLTLYYQCSGHSKKKEKDLGSCRVECSFFPIIVDKPFIFFNFFFRFHLSFRCLLKKLLEIKSVVNM